MVGTTYKRKHLMGGLSMVSKGYPMVIMVENTASDIEKNGSGKVIEGLPLTQKHERESAGAH